MRKKAEETLKVINRLVAEKVNQYGGGSTAEQISKKLNISLEEANKRYKLRSDQLYNRVRDAIPDGFMGNVDNTVLFAKEYLELAKSASRGENYDLAVKKAQQLMTEVKQKGGISFEDLKAFRGQIRTLIDDSVLSGGSSKPAKEGLNRLYDALTRDLDALVTNAGKEIGDPSLYAKYQRASRFVKQELKVGGDTQIIRTLIDKNQKDITSALRALERGAKGNTEQLRILKKKFTNEEWDQVSGYMLGALGTKRGLTGGSEIAEEAGEIVFKGQDNFNISTYLRNVQNLSPEAKSILFGGKKNQKLLKELNLLNDTIQRVAKDAKDMANPSGTARIGFGMAFLSSGFTNAGGVGFDLGFGGLAVPWLSAKLMTNPDFVRWMATGVSKSVYQPNSMGDHIRRLIQIWEVNPEIRDEIQAMLPALQVQTLDPVDEHASTNQRETESQYATQTQAERNFQQRVPASIANEVLPTSLMAQANSITIPDVGNEIPMGLSADERADLEPFEPLDDIVDSDDSERLGLSSIILPNPADREIAMRQQEEDQDQGGIASLV